MIKIIDLVIIYFNINDHMHTYEITWESVVLAQSEEKKKSCGTGRQHVRVLEIKLMTD